MDKKNYLTRWMIFPTVIGNLSRCGSYQENLKSLVEENTALRLENSKLRERLGEVETDAPVKAKHVRKCPSHLP